MALLCQTAIPFENGNFVLSKLNLAFTSSDLYIAHFMSRLARCLLCLHSMVVVVPSNRTRGWGRWWDSTVSWSRVSSVRCGEGGRMEGWERWPPTSPTSRSRSGSVSWALLSSKLPLPDFFFFPPLFWLFLHFVSLRNFLYSYFSPVFSLRCSADICSVLEVSYQTVSTELVREYLGGIDG